MITLLLIVQLIPAIIQLIKTAEELIPIPQQGKSKLDFVLGVITETASEVGDLIPEITKLIDRIVAVHNATGAFRHVRA